MQSAHGTPFWHVPFTSFLTTTVKKKITVLLNSHMWSQLVKLVWICVFSNLFCIWPADSPFILTLLYGLSAIFAEVLYISFFYSTYLKQPLKVHYHLQAGKTPGFKTLGRGVSSNQGQGSWALWWTCCVFSKEHLENQNFLQVSNNWHLQENVNYNKGRKYALKYIKIHKERIKLMVPWENWHWNYYLFLAFCVTFSGPQWTERCDVLKSLHAHLASGHNRKEQRGTWQKWVALLLRLKGFYHCSLIAIIIRVLQWISFCRPSVILTSAFWQCNTCVIITGPKLHFLA